MLVVHLHVFRGGTALTCTCTLPIWVQGAQALIQRTPGMGVARPCASALTIPETPGTALPLQHEDALRRQALGAGGPGRNVENSPSKRAPKSLRVTGESAGKHCVSGTGCCLPLVIADLTTSRQHTLLPPTCRPHHVLANLVPESRDAA